MGKIQSDKFVLCGTLTRITSRTQSTNVNFDATHEIEEQLGGETLTASSKKRCKNLDPNMLPGGASGKFAEKLKELETKFTVGKAWHVFVCDSYANANRCHTHAGLQLRAHA